MNKKTRFVKCVIAVVTVFTCVGFAGCVDDEKDLHNADETNGPKDFGFSTKKIVEINQKYEVSDDYRVNFEMYTKSPIVCDGYKSYVKDSTLVPFLSGRSEKGGVIRFIGELPSSVHEIYAYSYGIGTPVLMKASVSDEGVVSAFQKAAVPVASSSRAVASPSGTKSWTHYNVELNTQKKLESVNKKISKTDKELIDKSFSVDQNYDIERGYYRPSIELTGNATVKIYSVQNGANSDRTNALAYFVHDKDKVGKPEDAALDLVFPELNKTTPAEGAGYKLLNKDGGETFEKGSCISFALFSDIVPGNIATKDAHVLYSYFGAGSWNSYEYPSKGSGDKGLVRAGAPHMVLSLLRETDDGHAIIALGFEDQPWSTSYGTNRGDFRDDIFIVEIDPKTSLPDDLPKPPTDEPSYDMQFSEAGILCFEDCWPAQGDYDINDVVVSYERTTYLKNMSIAKFEETYTFLNNGAKFLNGFGYQLMGAKRSDVKECTVMSNYKFKGQGLDATSNEAMVMLFDNAKILTKGTTFTVSTLLNSDALVSGFNPFVVTKGNFGHDLDILANGRIEIHLPTPANAKSKFLPTGKANTGYFGTLDDKSIPGSKVYYVREGNYPFALDLKWDSSKSGKMSEFIIPKEEMKIELIYPEFTGWVKSNGKNNKDWYLHPNK